MHGRRRRNRSGRRRRRRRRGRRYGGGRLLHRSLRSRGRGLSRRRRTPAGGRGHGGRDRGRRRGGRGRRSRLGRLVRLVVLRRRRRRRRGGAHANQFEIRHGRRVRGATIARLLVVGTALVCACAKCQGLRRRQKTWNNEWLKHSNHNFASKINCSNTSIRFDTFSRWVLQYVPASSRVRRARRSRLRVISSAAAKLVVACLAAWAKFGRCCGDSRRTQIRNTKNMAMDE
jgi:hypothetical protein